MDNARTFSQGGVQRWEPARRAHRASEGGFPRLSRARHFHGAPGWSSEPGSKFSDTVHELTLGALHFQSGFGVGSELCELFEFGQRHARSQQALARGISWNNSNGVAQGG